MRLLIVLVLAACGGPAAEARSRPPPTEADACDRMCEKMSACGIAPPSCAAQCAHDQAMFRPGVQSANATCVERELTACDRLAVTDRRQIIAICWTATLDTYAKDDSALKTLIGAVCARLVRCGSADSDCVEKMMAKRAGTVQSKTMSVLKPELVASTASCIEKVSCGELDPMEKCR
jgi:hypothetical protein